jgi:hypothetical protein
MRPPESMHPPNPSVDTESIVLSPEFLAAIRGIVPRRRRAKLPYIVAAGLLAVVGALAADGSTREVIAGRWRHAPVATATATAMVTVDRPPAIAPTPAPSVATVEARMDNPMPAVTASTVNTPGTPAKPKKTRPRRAAPGAAGNHVASE